VPIIRPELWPYKQTESLVKETKDVHVCVVYATEALELEF